MFSTFRDDVIKPVVHLIDALGQHAYIYALRIQTTDWGSNLMLRKFVPHGIRCDMSEGVMMKGISLTGLPHVILRIIKQSK